MRMFVRVADAKSFTKAAREAGVGQPAVSKQIATLEARLGGQLVRRTSRGMALTDAGQRFYESAVGVLGAFDAAEAQVGRGERSPVGLVRVTAPPAFGAMHLVPRLPAFFAHYPDISIELLVSQQYLNLVEDGIDVAIRMGDLVDSELRSRRIGAVAAVTLAATGYLERRGTPQMPADLHRHDCITSVHRGAARAWRFAGPDGPVRLVPSGGFRSDDAEHGRAAMRAGLGILQGAGWLLERDIADGTARAVLQDFQCGPFPIHAVWSGDRPLSKRSRIVIDFIAQICAENPSLRIR